MHPQARGAHPRTEILLKSERAGDVCLTKPVKRGEVGSSPGNYATLRPAFTIVGKGHIEGCTVWPAGYDRFAAMSGMEGIERVRELQAEPVDVPLAARSAKLC